MQDNPRKFAQYPLVGERSCAELCAVARAHGMKIIVAHKPDMSVCHFIGLFGTSEQMQAVEAEWAKTGNTPTPKKYRAVHCSVDLRRPPEVWVENMMSKAIAQAIPTDGGWRFRLAHDGGEVQAPLGFRPLSTKEQPRKGDIAWNGGALVWEPINLEQLKSHGAALFKEHAYGVLRPQKASNPHYMKGAPHDNRRTS